MAGAPFAGAAELSYLLLADALAACTLRITEVGSGMVPRLLADNAGELDVLVLDGEQLIGAKQNRMTNRTILLPGRKRTEIPVSCMEQGRWRFDSEHFAASPQHSPAKVRRKARDLEAAYVAEGMVPADGVLFAAQGAVWSEIDAVSFRAGSESRSLALDGAFDASSKEIETWAKAFSPVEGQVGLVGLTRVGGDASTGIDAIGMKVIGMDVIGSPVLYARLHERLLRGYIMDALDTMRERPRGTTSGGPCASEPTPREDARIDDATADNATADDATVDDGAVDDGAVDLLARAQRFLDAVREAERTPAPSVGRGRYEVLSGTVVGGALSDDALDPERLVHNSAFPLQSGDAPHPSDGPAMNLGPVPPPSTRRRTR